MSYMAGFKIYTMNFDEFKIFATEFKNVPTFKKMKIALRTDFLNNRGAFHFKNGDIDSAIDSFNQALEIMPTNDDALLNLARCYTIKEEYKYVNEFLRKLYYLNESNKSKIVAYFLLIELIDNFDEYGGAVYSSTLIRNLQDNNVNATDNDIVQSLEKINKPYNRDILTYKIGSGMLGIPQELMYLTTDGTTIKLIRDELKDVLNWN